MTRKDIIKSNLSHALKKSGMKPIEIAKLTKISCVLIKNYIDKKSLPSIKNFCKIAITLNLNINNILDVHK